MIELDRPVMECRNFREANPNWREDKPCVYDGSTWHTPEDRGFNEVDLRAMLEQAFDYQRDVVVGRWVIETRHAGRMWEVIVEPDGALNLLIVVTAFPVWES